MQNQAIIPTSTKRSYKSAGTHWITTIPTDWRMQRVKSLLGERNERGHPSEPLLAATQSQGVVLKEKYDSRTVLPSNEVDQFKLVREGDFVISLRSFQGGIEYTYDQGIISPAYTVIYPYNPLTRDYFARLFKSRPFVQNLATCVTGIREGQNIDYTRLQVQTIPVPPPDEQAAIARFLDHADDQIQRYIASKERLIALLAEQRQAVIHQAVTRGLDPNVRLKDSGVEWLGGIPDGWDLVRIKSVARVRYGLGQPPPEKDGGLPLIRATNVSRGHILEHDMVYVDPQEVPQNREAFLSEGEIIVVRSGAYTADSAIIPPQYNGAVTGYDMVLKPTEILPEFLGMALLTNYLRDDQLIINSTRAAQPHLNAEELGNALIILPPKEEQINIAMYLDDLTASIDTAVAQARRQIELMEEYRTRLIADVVTGKIDVREAKP